METEKSKRTRKLILEISAQLFMEKGFDRTSMRDIVDAIGMSKGAIYHHFKSKEEIMTAVYALQDEMIQKQYATAERKLKGKNGREQLISLLEHSMQMSQEKEIDPSLSGYIKSPEFILKYMQDNVSKNAPVIAEIIRKGNEDGSLQCEAPEECAEAFLLLLNIWCDPSIFSAHTEKMIRKMKFIQIMMKGMGVDILKDSMISKIEEMEEEN